MAPSHSPTRDFIVSDPDTPVPPVTTAVPDDLCARCGVDLQGTFVPDPDDGNLRICLFCDRQAKGIDPTEEEYQQRLEARRAYLTDNYPFYLRDTLDNWRVPQGRTRDCTKAGVPPAIWALIPPHVLTAMRAGSIAILNGVGFGLIGATGVGKSGVKSVLAKGYYGVRFRHWLEHNPFHHEPDLPQETIAWLNWPDVADDLSRMGTDATGIESFQSRNRRASLLILDDLGRERFAARSDESATPFHQAQLERLIDARNEARKPIFWNSNLGMKDLLRLYGSAFMSRLVQSNPPIEVPAGLPNLRLQ